MSGTVCRRADTRRVRVGSVVLGGGSPVRVQSMTTTDTRDVRATVRQIRALEEAGCEIARVGVPDMEAARALGAIKKGITIPLVADIHFDHRLALEAVAQGVDKLRINPGNIGSADKVSAVVRAARAARIPIRIGVNAGSLKAVRGHAAGPRAVELRAAALVESALEHVRILEGLNFEDVVVSLKASDVLTTIAAYRLFAARRPYPLHLGVTEAGSSLQGTVKSSVGLGVLLSEGLGDTIRVSLTADPVEEVRVAYQILQALELRSTGIEIISCPTCSRTEVDLIAIAARLEKALAPLAGRTRVFEHRPVRIAVMGCSVNGPGEAADADFGIAGSKGKGYLFENGTVRGPVPEKQWVSTLISLVRARISQQSGRRK